MWREEKQRGGTRWGKIEPKGSKGGGEGNKRECERLKHKFNECVIEKRHEINWLTEMNTGARLIFFIIFPDFLMLSIFPFGCCIQAQFILSLPYAVRVAGVCVCV